jgi:hypothetical protein
MYSEHMYENRTMKLAEIVLRWGERERKNEVGSESN